MFSIKKDKKIRNIVFRCSDEDFNQIKQLALLYSAGNMSEYCLYAIKNFQITEKDLDIKRPPIENKRPVKKTSKIKRV